MSLSLPRGDVSMTAELIFEDPRRDLALLAVPIDLPPLEIEPGYRFRRGQDVTVIGNPGVGDKLILKNAVSRGVMSTEAVIDGQRFFQLNIAINPGNSGGPTIDSSGKVVGVVTLKVTQLEATAFCIPADDLLSAIAHAATRPSDKDAALTMHRARYIALRLSAVGEFYSDALSRAVAGMDVAIAKRLDPNRAISEVRQDMTAALNGLKPFFTDDFDAEFDRVYTDVRIADSVRHNLGEISKNCVAMKTAIDAPDGTADSYRERASLLQEKHRWYIERLRADLGMTNPQ